jgi:hypothetical protein
VNVVIIALGEMIGRFFAGVSKNNKKMPYLIQHKIVEPTSRHIE